MRLIFAVSVLLIASAGVVVRAQNAYNSILAEAQQWQRQNPLRCGQDVSTCGVTGLISNFANCNDYRIYNGCAVERPLTVGWQAAVLIEPGVLCSGVLIGPQHVMTAAHCLHEVRTPSAIKVILGTNIIRNSNSDQRYEASSFGVHSNFNINKLSSDVAFIKLARPAFETDQVNGIRAACLPTAGTRPPSNKVCMISGFGTNNPKHGVGSGSGAMRYSLLQKKVDQECQAAYGGFDPSDSFCAVGERNSRNTGTCQGDSGSSLLCADGDGRWVAYGVVSYGATNCDDFPSVFADVAKLGITVPPRSADKYQNPCPTSADQRPELPTGPQTPVHPSQPNQGPKKPTFSGSSSSITDTVHTYGCRSDGECQSNVCRPVALCTEKNDDLNSIISGNDNGKTTIGTGNGAGSWSATTPSYVSHNNFNTGKPHLGKAQAHNQMLLNFKPFRAIEGGRYSSATVSELLGSNVSTKQQSTGAKSAAGRGVKAVSGNVNLLFARRNCQMHLLCSAERSQRRPQESSSSSLQQQSSSQLLVAMFDDNN